MNALFAVLFVAGYVLLGFAVFGHRKKFGCFATLLYFVVFPLHAVTLGIIATIADGVSEHLELWKCAAWLFYIFVIVCLCALMAMPR